MTLQDSHPATADFASLVGRAVADELRDAVASVLTPVEHDVLAGVEAIAVYCGLSERFVRDHMGSTIPGRKVGTKWLASKVAITAWLARPT
ncbi:hypothetical protein [Euzebya sp.]|uniref:hypothetical protein n=1 Tax=Euzebya sp. TaxID=1971409 RepID=UPI003518E442